MVPLFTTHYSIGKSILTLDDIKEKGDGDNTPSPDSVFSILINNKLTKLFLIEDNLTSSAIALKKCKKYNIDLHLGLKITLCNDMRQKDEESTETEHKVVLFAKNDSGYDKLLKIYSIGATEGFYRKPRIDCSTLKSYYSDNELLLVYPFYDSFLHRNYLNFAKCTDCDFAPKNFFVEDNGLPFEYLIKDAIKKYAQNNKIRIIKAKSIYYNNKKDIKPYITYRALTNGFGRGTLNAPNIEHLGSDRFCFEAWKEEKEENSVKG